MKNKLYLAPNAKPAVKVKTVFIYATATMTLIAVITWLTFLSLNLGNTEKALAATNYSSVQSGDWTAAATWGGSAPAVTNFADNAFINSNHNVTRMGNLDIKNGASITINGNAKLTINGDMTVQNNLTLMINGELIVNGNIQAKNGANITVNGSGKITTTGNIELQQNANFYVDGIVNVGGDMSFGNNANFGGNGQVNIVGNGCSNWAGPGSCNENIALPVQLISFILSHSDEGVHINWKTASEENNDFFTVEQSEDGINFKPIGTVKGNGTVKAVSSYEYTDEYPVIGRSYYRLSQTDYDGRMETFKPAMIEVSGDADESTAFSVYPNPLKGSTLNVNFTQPSDGMIEILDNRGNRVFAGEVTASNREMKLSLADNMEPGMYYVNFRTTRALKTVKIVKQ